MTPPGPRPAFPVARGLAVLWLAVWGIAYARGWGLANFLHLCDLAVILTGAGLWLGSPLLLSSQALSSLVLDLAWDVDLAWRVATGQGLIGGTEYMVDPRFPLALRLLSLFHVGLPLLLLWAVRRVGYDGRALALQAAIAVVAVAAGRLAPAEANINYAHADPFFGRAWGPAPVHVAVIVAPLVLGIYWPTHRALRAWMPEARGARGAG